MLWAAQIALYAGNVNMRSSNLKLCQCPALVRHRMKIFSSAWLEPIVIRGASIKKGSGYSIKGMDF
jgi:hypothetical protein